MPLKRWTRDQQEQAKLLVRQQVWNGVIADVADLSHAPPAVKHSMLTRLRKQAVQTQQQLERLERGR